MEKADLINQMAEDAGNFEKGGRIGRGSLCRLPRHRGESALQSLPHTGSRAGTAVL